MCCHIYCRYVLTFLCNMLTPSWGQKTNVAASFQTLRKKTRGSTSKNANSVFLIPWWTELSWQGLSHMSKFDHVSDARLFAVVPRRKSQLSPEPDNMGTVMDEVVLNYVNLPTFVFSCQDHSTDYPRVFNKLPTTLYTLNLINWQSRSTALRF